MESRVDLEQLRIDRKGTGPRGKRRRPSRWIWLTVLLVAVVALSIFYRGSIALFLDRAALTKVKVLKIEKKSAASVAAITGASANGYVVARTRAALSADTPGRIVEMNVQEGSVVKEGDVVARIFSDEYRASLQRAEAEVVLAERGADRARASIAAAEQRIAGLRADVGASEAEVAQVETTERLAAITFDRAAKLLADKVDTGDRRDRAESELENARARIRWTRARLEVARQAVGSGESALAVARAEQAEAVARVLVAAAARALARVTLDKTDVRAPFSGVVVLKDAEVGEVVSPNVQGGSNARGSVVTMVDFETLEVQAEVPETSLASVKVAGGARLYLDAFPDRPYNGRVDRIWPTANRTKATVEVRVTFLERDERLRPEMGVRIVFTDEKNTDSADPTLLVPEDALVTRAGVRGVWRVEQDLVRFVAVVCGEARAGKVAILSGIISGDRIVARPPATLKDGERVAEVP